MGRIRRKIRSSRRVPSPKDSDFDHEIVLCDSSEDGSDTCSPIATRRSRPSSQAGPSTRGTPETASGVEAPEHVVPSVHVEVPTPQAISEPSASGRQTRKKDGKTVETAIDILYENQRGLFLCGVALFSAKALGNLDPPPWTNGMHKPSPTDIGTAQVPDPSWVWEWPEWKINHDEGSDGGGWEYSFMFSNKFSWHGPTWWNSYVRRRAWIRKRVKKQVDYDNQDTSTLNPDYFSVLLSSETSSRKSPSRVSGSKLGSSVSLMSSHVADQDETTSNINEVESLLAVLRVSAIDRVKIEAVDNYLQHAGDDLVHLQEKMHEIMALFVFQASRRVLLTRLTEVYEGSLAQLKTSSDAALKARIRHLSAAVKHADEEVRRLEYWSDVKGMAEENESRGAVDVEKRREESETMDSCP